MSEIKAHPDHGTVHQDGDMMNPGPNTKYISAPTRYPNTNSNQRTLCQYEDGVWRVESQIYLDNEWWVASRNTLTYPPDGENKVDRATGKEVNSEHKMFTDLPLTHRVVLSPVYALIFAWMCVRGEDINLQILSD